MEQQSDPKQSIFAIMKFGLSDRVIEELQTVFVRHPNDLLDYSKTINTPIGEHIDRVGQVFYQSA